MQHKEQLEHLLVGTDNRIQTYKFKGNKVNKTLSLASSAVALLEDCRQEFNLTQRAIIETPLAEFIQRHTGKRVFDRLKEKYEDELDISLRYVQVDLVR